MVDRKPDIPELDEEFTNNSSSDARGGDDALGVDAPGIDAPGINAQERNDARGAADRYADNRDEDETDTSRIPLNTFPTACANYAHEHQSARANYLSRCVDAYNEMVRIHHEAYRDAARPVREAEYRLMIACNNAYASADAWREYVEAYQDAVKARADFANDQKLRERRREACDRYAEAEREARETAENDFRTAYSNFVRAMKGAWGRVDPDRVKRRAA